MTLLSSRQSPRQFPLRPYTPRQFPLHPYSLSREDVHDAPGGGIVVRSWGEREDPWKNPLCFVEEGTVYTG